jgi:hypothetical protein
MNPQTRITVENSNTIIVIEKCDGGYMLVTDPENYFLSGLLENSLGGDVFAEERHVLVRRMELLANENGLMFVNEETSDVAY